MHYDFLFNHDRKTPFLTQSRGLIRCVAHRHEVMLRAQCPHPLASPFAHISMCSGSPCGSNSDLDTPIPYPTPHLSGSSDLFLPMGGIVGGHIWRHSASGSLWSGEGVGVTGSQKPHSLLSLPFDPTPALASSVLCLP